MTLAQLNRQQFVTVFGNRETPAQVREKLEQIVGLQEQLATLRDAMKQTQAEIDTQFSDQERLRENLKALRTGAEDQQMRSRYLGQLRKQEDQIDAARVRIAGLNTQVVTVQTRLNDAIATLTWE